MAGGGTFLHSGRVFVDLLMPNASNEDRNWLAELERETVSPDMAVRLWKAFHSIDVRNCLKNIKIPTLVFHATGDRLVPFEEGKQLAGLIPDAKFVPLKGNNHILLRTDPAWFRFLAEFRSFICWDKNKFDKCDMHDMFPELTSRECEVLRLLSRGLKNSQIAELLFISPKTVRNHVYNIF